MWAKIFKFTHKITMSFNQPDDNLAVFGYYPRPRAEVVELVDTTDSKSVAFAGLRVRVPPSVPIL